MNNSLLKNSVFKAILSICNILIPLIVGPYVTRLLDVELFGAFNKVIAEFNVFLTIATFGIYTYGVKEISKIRNDKQKVCELFSNLFVISLITNTVIMIIYIIYASLVSSGITFIIYIVTLILFVSNMIYVEYVNEALENYSYITKKTLIVRIIYLLCILLFVKKPENIIIYAVIFCLSTFVNNILSYSYIKKHFKFNFKKLKITKYIKPLFMVFLITSAEILYFQLDQVMLGKVVSDVAVTVYQIPYTIMSRIITIPTAILSVSIPRLSNLFAENKKAYSQKINDVMSYFIIMLLPICLGIFVLSEEIILLYAGKNYIESIPLLMTFSITRIIIGMESFMTLLIFYINNKEKSLLKIFMSFGAVNLLTKILFSVLKILTPLSAALSTSACYLALIIFQYFYIKKNLLHDIKIFSKRNVTYIVLSLLFIPISFCIKCLSLPFLVSTALIIVICIVLYGGTLLLIKDEIIMNVLDKFKLKFKKESK